jgi:hypothetical protein
VHGPTARRGRRSAGCGMLAPGWRGMRNRATAV